MMKLMLKTENRKQIEKEHWEACSLVDVKMYCKATIIKSIIPAERLIVWQNRVQNKVYVADEGSVACDHGTILKLFVLLYFKFLIYNMWIELSPYSRVVVKVIMCKIFRTIPGLLQELSKHKRINARIYRMTKAPLKSVGKECIF